MQARRVRKLEQGRAYYICNVHGAERMNWSCGKVDEFEVARGYYGKDLEVAKSIDIWGGMH